MANQIASGMTEEDKDEMDSMDMEKMISHVTKNVFKMMGNLNNNDSQDFQDDSSNQDQGVCNEENEEIINSVNTVNTINTINSTVKGSNINNNTNKLSINKTNDIIFDLEVTLEELYNGKKKKINVKRKIISDNNGIEELLYEKIKLNVVLEKGMGTGNKIVFKGESDKIPGYEQGDIIINIIELPHSEYTRIDNNLFIEKNISLCEAYKYINNFVCLDGRVISIVNNDNDNLYYNNSIRKISGEGMPIYKGKDKGDLYINFILNIPKYINSKQYSTLKEALLIDDKLLPQNHNILTLEKPKKDELKKYYDIEEFNETDSVESEEYLNSDLSDS